MKSLSKIILAAALLAPARLFACATCYANGAQINDPMVDGMNWAILTLGVVIATVLGTFLAYFIFIMRKGEKLEAAGQTLDAIRSYRQALATLGKFFPADPPATKLKDLEKKYPDLYKTALALPISPKNP